MQYNKFSDASALKVTFYGGLRAKKGGCTCAWYFTFDGRQCEHPNIVQGNVYNQGGSDPNSQEEEGTAGTLSCFECRHRAVIISFFYDIMTESNAINDCNYRCILLCHITLAVQMAIC